MKIQTVLFDWDGCLAQTLGAWLEVYRSVLDDYSLKKTDKEIVDTLFGTGFQGPLAFGIKDPAAFYEKIDALIADKLRHVALYPQAKETVRILVKNDINLAVVTSSDRHLLEPALQHNELQNVFDITITFDDVTNTKPHPEPLQKAMAHLSAVPERTIIIGDSPHDVEAGKAAGVQTALFFPPENRLFYREEALRKNEPDYFVHSFEEFLKKIL